MTSLILFTFIQDQVVGSPPYSTTNINQLNRSRDPATIDPPKVQGIAGRPVRLYTSWPWPTASFLPTSRGASASVPNGPAGEGFRCDVSQSSLGFRWATLMLIVMIYIVLYSNVWMDGWIDR